MIKFSAVSILRHAVAVALVMVVAAALLQLFQLPSLLQSATVSFITSVYPSVHMKTSGPVEHIFVNIYIGDFR